MASIGPLLGYFLGARSVLGPLLGRQKCSQNISLATIRFSQKPTKKQQFFLLLAARWAVLGCSWALLGRSWAALGPFSWGARGVLAASGETNSTSRVLGRSWGVLDRSWAALGALLGSRGRTGGALGSSWRTLGSWLLWGRSWPHLGCSRRIQKAPQRFLLEAFGCLGSIRTFDLFLYCCCRF